MGPSAVAMRISYTPTMHKHMHAPAIEWAYAAPRSFHTAVTTGDLAVASHVATIPTAFAAPWLACTATTMVDSAMAYCAAHESILTSATVWAYAAPRWIRTVTARGDSAVASRDTPHCHLRACRVGEASHPGPRNLLHSLDDPDGWDSECDCDGCDIAAPTQWPQSSDVMAGPVRGTGLDTPPVPCSSGRQDCFLPETDCSHPDYGIDSTDLSQWRSVEADLKLSTNWEQPSAPRPRPPPSLPIPGNAFIPCRTFAGSMADYVFTTRAEGTGYYNTSIADRNTTAPTPICLANVIPPPSLDLLPPPIERTRRARHARYADGRRRRKSCTQPTGTWQAESHTELANDDWRKDKIWAIDTSNANAWSTAATAVLPRSVADIVLLQETRIHNKDALVRAANAATACGWRAVFAPALRTGFNSSSAGCAVCTKKGIGMHPHAVDIIQEGSRCRFKAAWVGGVLRGGIHCCSVYLKDSVGASETNLNLLQEVATFLSCVKGPWVIGGDWNMSPQLLESTQFLSMVHGVIVAPDSPTCNGSIYDYFVISEGLLPAVAGIARIDDAGLSPHWPTRLYLRSDARRHLVRQLVRPRKVPGLLPCGPTTPVPDYSDATPSSVSQSEVDTCMSVWYSKAREEWHALTAHETSHRVLSSYVASDARFKWSPAAGAIATPGTGATRSATHWRSVARRFQEVANLLERPTADKAALISRHLSKVWRSLEDPPSCQAAGSTYMWTLAITRATHEGNIAVIRQLVKVADKAAEKAETASRHSRLKAWRDRLSAKNRPGCRMPSKNAFNWVRGPSGWVPSPIGDSLANECIPEEGDWDLEFSDLPHGSHPTERSRIWRRQEFGQPAPLCDQATVEAEADSWACSWNELQEYQCGFSVRGSPPLPTMLPSLLRQAAKTFPVGTGLGADNISPRALCRLSDNSIKCLCKLLVTMELLGSWASAMNLVLIVLLPKPDGGRRPIGLFPTIIRVWMRARAQCAHGWESANHRHCLYGGPSMGAQRASWQAAFAAETAARSGKYFAQSLLDLVMSKPLR